MDNHTRFNLTAEDYIEANRLHATRACYGGGLFRLGVLMWPFYAVLAFVVSGEWSWRHGAAAIAVGAALSAIVVLFIFIINSVMIPRKARRIFAQQKSLHEDIEASWDDTALDLSTPSARSRHEWSDFRKWSEGSNVILLYQSDALFNMLPKRAFSPDGLADIRERLSQGNVRLLSGWC